MALSRYYHNFGLILIVDDNPDNLRLLSKILESKGFKVKKTVSGKVAIQAAKIEPPDLIYSILICQK
jgi:CheY-like chemotaxis protein